MHFYLVEFGVDEFEASISAIYDLHKVFLGLEQRNQLLFVACLLESRHFLCDLCLNLIQISGFGSDKVLYGVSGSLQLEFHLVDAFYRG